MRGEGTSRRFFFYAIFLRDITCGAFNLLYIHVRCSLSVSFFLSVTRAQIFAYEIEGKRRELQSHIFSHSRIDAILEIIINSQWHRRERERGRNY